MHFGTNSVTFCNKIAAFYSKGRVFNKTVAFWKKKVDACCNKLLSHCLVT